MMKSDSTPFLSVSRLAGSKSQLFFRLDVPIGQDLDIQPGESARLVNDANRPTFLGLRWGSDGYEEESAPARCESRIRLPGRGEVRLTWTLALDDYSAESFLPADKKAYGTEIQVDRKTRTVWCPLPAGRSVNGLGGLLGFEDDSLYHFVRDWFLAKDADRPLPFQLPDDDTSVSYDEAAWMFACHSEDMAAMDWVYIPDELLRDPIRNGSTDPSDGYNPWNYGQKAAIVAHLEHELARLTTLFQQELASPPVDHALA